MADKKEEKEQKKKRGGVIGFIAGFCFGVRAGGDYNAGKEVHWREWIRLLVIPAIWDAIEGAQGVTTSELANRYGAAFY